MRYLIFLLFALAAPLSAQEQLTFNWSSFTHPQFREYAWALHSDGQPIDAGRTQQTSITVTVPSNVYASYHVTVSWVHRQNGKLTWHTSTETQSIVEPSLPPDTVTIPPPDTVAPIVRRIGALVYGATTWKALVWDSVHVVRPAGQSVQLQLCAYDYRDDIFVQQEPLPPMCPAPPTGDEVEEPPISGPGEPAEWLNVDFGSIDADWYYWTDGGHLTHVDADGLTVQVAADTEGYAGLTSTPIDMRGKEVVARFLETPRLIGSEAWLVISDGTTRYFHGRAGARVVSRDGIFIDSGGWRSDWDIVIRHEGNELLFQTIQRREDGTLGNAGTRYRVPLDIDLSAITITLMAGTRSPIRSSDEAGRWGSLVVRPSQ